MKLPTLLRHLTLLLLLATAAGCSTTLFKQKIALSELTFEVAPGANDDTPFAVELVAVTDDAVLEKLLSLTAAQWFDPQSNLKRDYPKVLETWYYELSPGQRLSITSLPFARRPAQGLLLFANYKGPGAHRLRLESYSKAKILFAGAGISVDDGTGAPQR